MNRALESHVDVPNGGRAARCQAVRKNGDQCKKPARTGFDVCGTHGAGYAKREAEGVSKPPGAPMLHGRFADRSGKTLLEDLARLQQDETDLDNTDDALRLLYAVLKRTLTLEPDVTMLQARLELLLSVQTLDPLAHHDTVESIDKLSRFMSSVHKQASEIIRLGKVRADTHVRLSQTKALDEFILNTRLLSDIVRSYTTADVYAAIIQTLEIKLLGPLGITVDDFESRSVT